MSTAMRATAQMIRISISLPITSEDPLHQNSAPSIQRHPGFRNVVTLAVHDRQLSLIRRPMLSVKKPPASPSDKAISPPSYVWLPFRGTCHGIDLSPSMGFRVSSTRPYCGSAVKPHGSISNVTTTKHAQSTALERAIIPGPRHQVKPVVKGESHLFEERREYRTSSTG